MPLPHRSLAPGRLQVLIGPSPSGVLVAGLPPAARLARAATEELSPARVMLCEDGSFAERYARQLRGLRVGLAPEPLDPEAPLLVLSSRGFAREGALSRALSPPPAQATAWSAGGRVVAAYFPRAKEAPRGPAAEAAGLALEVRADGAVPLEGWLAADDAASRRRAERQLCRALAKDNDGYLARFDRRLSTALSRLLVRLPVTPNAITTAGLALGLAGAWGLASATRGGQFSGALVLWVCCILDGCDGEVARLKLLSSDSGATYDVAADHLAHLATFAAIPIGVHRLRPSAAFARPGLLLLCGFALSTFSVYWLVLRLPESRRGRFSLFIERIASRDYVYLLVAATALGRLDWFLWAAGIGSHVFYLALWTLALRRAPALEATGS